MDSPARKSRDWKIETLPDDPAAIKINDIKRADELARWRKAHPELVREKARG